MIFQVPGRLALASLDVGAQVDPPCVSGKPVRVQTVALEKMRSDPPFVVAKTQARHDCQFSSGFPPRKGRRRPALGALRRGAPFAFDWTGPIHATR